MINTKEEIWEFVPGWHKRYMVSNMGHVKTCSNGRWGNVDDYRYLKLKVNPAGYYAVTLYWHGKKKDQTVHRLVAQAFIPNPDNKPFINHIDGNKKNNIVTNLEWVTPSENTYHAVRTGLLKNSAKQRESTRKRMIKPVFGIRKSDGKRFYFKSATDAVNATGADISEIIKCCRGKAKSAKGYIWEYAPKE